MTQENVLRSFEKQIVSRLHYLTEKMFARGEVSLGWGVGPEKYLKDVKVVVEMTHRLFDSLCDAIGHVHHQKVTEEMYAGRLNFHSLTFGMVVDIPYTINLVRDGVDVEGNIVSSDYMKFSVGLRNPEKVNPDLLKVYQSIFN